MGSITFLSTLSKMISATPKLAPLCAALGCAAAQIGCAAAPPKADPHTWEGTAQWIEGANVELVTIERDTRYAVVPSSSTHLMLFERNVDSTGSLSHRQTWLITMPRKLEVGQVVAIAPGSASEGWLVEGFSIIGGMRNHALEMGYSARSKYARFPGLLGHSKAIGANSVALTGIAVVKDANEGRVTLELDLSAPDGPQASGRFSTAGPQLVRTVHAFRHTPQAVATHPIATRSGMEQESADTRSWVEKIEDIEPAEKQSTRVAQ